LFFNIALPTPKKTNVCTTNQEELLVRSEVENNEDLKEIETHFSLY